MESNFTINGFNFNFVNDEIDEEIFNVFNLNTDLEDKRKNPVNKYIKLKTSIKQARKRYFLKKDITRDELQEAIYLSCNSIFWITYDYDNQGPYDNMNFDEDYKLDNYLNSIKAVFIMFKTKPFFNHISKLNDIDKVVEYISNSFNDITFSSRVISAIETSIKNSYKSADNDIDEQFLLTKPYRKYLLPLLLLALPDDFEIEYDLECILASFNYKVEKLQKYDRTSKILVFTEGKTDGVYLEPALLNLNPRMADCFQFIPMESIQSGCSELKKYMEICINSNLKSKIIFIFDSDSSGYESYSAAKESNRYIKKMLLPNDDIFSNYPCYDLDNNIVKKDIYQKAVTVELMYPKETFTFNGALSPIRWNGYNEKLKQYQGQLSDKSKTQKNIKEIIKNKDFNNDDNRFKRLVSLFDSMIKIYQI